MLMTMIGAFFSAITYLVVIKAFLFTVDELNVGLVNIKEAIEDLEEKDNDRQKIKSLRRLFERTGPLSGYGMFEVCSLFVYFGSRLLDNFFNFFSEHNHLNYFR